MSAGKYALARPIISQSRPLVMKKGRVGSGEETWGEEGRVRLFLCPLHSLREEVLNPYSPPGWILDRDGGERMWRLWGRVLAPRRSPPSTRPGRTGGGDRRGSASSPDGRTAKSCRCWKRPFSLEVAGCVQGPAGLLKGVTHFQCNENCRNHISGTKKSPGEDTE